MTSGVSAWLPINWYWCTICQSVSGANSSILVMILIGLHADNMSCSDSCIPFISLFLGSSCYASYSKHLSIIFSITLNHMVSAKGKGWLCQWHSILQWYCEEGWTIIFIIWYSDVANCLLCYCKNVLVAWSEYQFCALFGAILWLRPVLLCCVITCVSMFVCSAAS
jgi:hypothetical protein